MPKLSDDLERIESSLKTYSGKIDEELRTLRRFALVGNGGGLIASLTFAGSMLKVSAGSLKFPWPLLLSVTFFILGLLTIALASFVMYLSWWDSQEKGIEAHNAGTAWTSQMNQDGEVWTAAKYETAKESFKDSVRYKRGVFNSVPILVAFSWIFGILGGLTAIGFLYNIAI